MKIKVLYILLVLISFNSFSQSKKDIKIKNMFWGQNDAYKNSTSIPDKWKNESAVIIYKNVIYDYHKFVAKVTYKTSIRKRIKLLDKAALNEFSEFSYSKQFRTTKGRGHFRNGQNVVGIKIIKEDGREIEIDVEKEAVEVDGETKIAISNLEIGDIIDYYYYSNEPFLSVLEYGFDPVETTLADDYPIMDFKLFLDTENDFFVNFNTYNGAPQLKEIPNKKSGRQYELLASNIDKFDRTRWFYPLVELPCYKFQVYFARSGKFENRAVAFLPNKEKIVKKTVTKEEVLELYDTRFKPSGDIGDVKDFFKDKTFKNDNEKVKEAYYYMRHYYLTRFIEAMIIYQAKIDFSPFSYYGNSVFIQSENQFVRHFSEFLKRHNIGYEIVIAKKRYDGTIDNLLIAENVNVILKIKTKQPLYAEFFGVNSDINEYSPDIEGTEVYVLSGKKGRLTDIRKDRLPMSKCTENENKSEITVSLEEDFSGISISRLNSFNGYAKKDVQFDKLIFSDYINEDYKKYGTKDIVDMIRRKKNKDKISKKLDAIIQKYKKNQNEDFEEQIENEFDVDEVEDYNYKIINTGRYGLETYFSYEESFKIKGKLIKKAGPNYIIEIGKLIGGQINPNERKQERTENIYMQNARVFNYNINLNIPEGYTVSGLDKLNKNIDNLTGSFTSSAKIENDVLIISTQKQYKNNYEPNSNWGLMVDFLEVAHQFTNEKILLKKS